MKKNLKKNTDVTSNEKARFLKQEPTQPDSKFGTVKQQETVAVRGRKNREKLSRNNFNFDLQGNYIMSDKLLLKRVYHSIINCDFVKVQSIKNVKFWKCEDICIDEDQWKLILEQLPKKVNDFYDKKCWKTDLQVIAKDLKPSEIWFEEEIFNNVNINKRKAREEKEKERELKESEDLQEKQPLEETIEEIEKVEEEKVDQQEEEIVISSTEIILEENKDSEMMIEMKRQFAELQAKLSDVLKSNAALLQQNSELMNMLKAKDSLIEQYRREAEEKSILQKQLVEQPIEVPVQEEPSTSTKEVIEQITPIPSPRYTGTIPKVKKEDKIQEVLKKEDRIEDSNLIEVFVDDGIDIPLTVTEETTPKQAMEILNNEISLTEEEKGRVINQGRRKVNSPKVNRKFNETLSENLKPSPQTMSVQEPPRQTVSVQKSVTLIEFTPTQRAKAKRDPNTPKGMLAARWKIISTLEVEKQAEAIGREYQRMFRTEFFVLQNRWRIAHKKVYNPFLTNSRLVWDTLKKNGNAKLWLAIQKWKETAKKFDSKDKEFNCNWFKSESKHE